MKEHASSNTVTHLSINQPQTALYSVVMLASKTMIKYEYDYKQERCKSESQEDLIQFKRGMVG